MEHKIVSFNYSGIKNAVNKVDFNFIDRKPEAIQGKVDNLVLKGIYGPNGSGKTAFIEAIDLYKNITTKPFYVEKFDEIILHNVNYNSDKVYLSATYYIENDGIREVPFEVKHDINLNINKKNMNNKVYIENEKIYIDGILQISTYEGSIVEKNESKISTDFIEFSKNALNTTSIVFKLTEYLKKGLDNEKNGEFVVTVSDEMMLIYSILATMMSTTIIFEEKDNHREFFLDFFKEGTEKGGELSKENYYKIMEYTNQNTFPSFSKPLYIKEKALERFDIQIAGLEKFMKIFNPNLIQLSYETKKLDDETVKITLFTEYSTGTLNMEFESVGLKKIADIYNAIIEVKKGKIVIIDEFDAHIHDVALIEILNYLIEQNKGQIIFTSHNLATMDEIKNIRNSIDIVDLNGLVTTWKQEGNEAPSKFYRNGYLAEDFGIGVTDFIKAFDD